MPKNPTPAPKHINRKHQARLERERIQNRIIVLVAGVVLALVVLLLGFGVLEETVLANNRAVAQVGDEKITTREFVRQARFTRYQLIQQYQQYAQFAQMFGGDPNNAGMFDSYLQQIAAELNNSQQLGGRVVETLIQNKIVRQEAARRGITVSKEEVDQALEAYFGYFPNGTPTAQVFPTPGPTATLSPLQLTLVPPTATPTAEPVTAATGEPASEATAGATLEPTGDAAAVEPTTAGPTVEPTSEPTATPYTLEGYQSQKQEYFSSEMMQTVDVDEAYFRTLLENNLYYQKVRDAIAGEQGLKAEEEKVWARHILVADETLAQVILDKLNAGEDFVALSNEYSTDEAAKAQGGDLGWFTREMMVKEFSDAAFAMTEIGEIAGPVQTTNGYHIIQLLGKQTMPLTPDAFERLKDEKMQEWLTAEAAKDTVKRFDSAWQDRVPTEPALSL